MGGATLEFGGASKPQGSHKKNKKKIKKIKILLQILLFFLILTPLKLFFFNLTPTLGAGSAPGHVNLKCYCFML